MLSDINISEYIVHMDSAAITLEEFVEAAQAFVEKSDRISDGWKLIRNTKDSLKTYIKKESFMCFDENSSSLLKTEYVIHYNLSYGVPAFSFNIWNSSGVLLTLEEIRQMSFVKINQKDFYSVITQQEHPIFFRPYFVMHPCHTEELIATFKQRSRNIIVTFLSLISPLIKLDLPMEYGL